MGLTGGCLCGAVRYELKSEPFDCGWCHCRTCQLNSGAPAMVFASVPRGRPRLDRGRGQGAIGRPRRSFGHREFCGECGTPFLMKVDHQPETVDFSVATLDDPNAIAPGFHIFWGSKVPLVRARATTCRGTTSSGRTRAGSKAPSRRTDSSMPALDCGVRRRDCPRATAGSGCAARRRPSARPAGRP